jgi:hypothetical protein
VNLCQAAHHYADERVRYVQAQVRVLGYQAHHDGACRYGEIARLLARPAPPGAAAHWLAFRRHHQVRARRY